MSKARKKPPLERSSAGVPAQDSRAAALAKRLAIMSIEIEVYREVGGLAVKGSDRSTILGRLMDFSLKAMETDSGALYLIEGDGSPVKAEAARGSFRRRGLKSLPCDAAGRAARTGKPYVCQEASGNDVLAVPLKLKRTTIGAIVVAGRGARRFTRADIKVLSSLSNHFSIVLEKADLFNELEGRVKQLATLNKVGNLLVSSLENAVVKHRAMEAVTKLMRAETGSLLLVDNDSNELYFEVALGEKGKQLKEVRLGVGEGIAGWVAKYGKPAIVHDVARDWRFQSRVDRQSKFTTRNMICVPIKIRGVVIGVLQAINRTGGGSFTRADLRVFQLFSNQVAIALDNARLYEEVMDTFYATSGALAEAIEKRDPYTGGHTRRVLEYCLAIAGQMGLSGRELEILKLSAVLHDIGKIGIEDRVLKKNAPLDVHEATSMKTHPLLGAEILKHVPKLKDVVPGMLYHHERVDGRGYPSGLKSDEIPLVARIISVADTYDAMTTTRPYREGLPASEAVGEIKRFSGLQFDPMVVKAFLKAFRNGEIDGVVRSPKKKRPLISKRL